VSPKVLVPHVPEVLSWCPLRPVYEDGSLEWLWGKAGEKRALGTLRACLVRESAGEVVGWFVYYARGSGESAVAQIAYRKPHLPLVMDHLFHDAWRTGATGLTGRLEPGLIPDLTRRGATFHRSGPWTLYHSDRLEIIKAIDQGNALLSRLEGEWWLSF